VLCVGDWRPLEIIERAWRRGNVVKRKKILYVEPCPANAKESAIGEIYET
jgi:hypothetical protein